MSYNKIGINNRMNIVLLVNFTHSSQLKDAF